MNYEIKLEKTTAELFDTYNSEYHKDCKCYQVTGFPKSNIFDFVVAKDFNFTSKWVMYEKGSGLLVTRTSFRTRKEAILKGVERLQSVSDEYLISCRNDNLSRYERYRSK